MTKDEALKLALEALGQLWLLGDKAAVIANPAITAIKQARALDKKAENARELGLDYEPVWCGHCNGSGRMVRDPDIGTDQECFVCDGAGVPAAPVQEPVAWMFEDDEDNGHKTFRQTPPSPEAIAYLAKWNRPAWVPLYTTPPAAQRLPLTDEQIKQIYTEQTGSFIDDSPWALLDFARAIEAAHGITGETKWTNNN